MASIKKNLVFNFLLSASQLLIPLFTIPYLAHVLEPSGVGKVSFVDAFTYYFIAIAEFGIVVYGMREVARLRANKDEMNLLVSELVTLHIVSSSVTIVAYCITISFLWSRILEWRLILFSISFLLTNSFACEWYYYGTEQFRYITSRSIFTRLCGLACIFLLIRQPHDYYIYYAIIAGSGILNIMLNFGKLIRELKLSLFRKGWTRHIRKTWITYSISLLYSISLMLDNVLLGLVSTAAFVGIYAFAIKFVRLSSAALTDTLLVFFPRAVKLLHMGEKEQFQKTILRNIQLLNLFSIPLGVGMYLLSNDIAAVVFGASFLQVAVDLRILCVVPFLRCFNLFLSKQVLIAYNNEKLYVRSLVISGIIFIGSTLILSSLFKDVGASISMVIYEFALLAVNYYFVCQTDRDLKVIDTRSLLHALLGSILFIPVVLLLQRRMATNATSLVVIISTCTIMYILFQLFIIRNEFMIALRSWALNYVAVALQKRKKE